MASEAIASYLYFALVSVYAIARGGVAEKSVGWMFIALHIVDVAFRILSLKMHFQHFEFLYFLIDAIILIFLMFLCIRFGRVWLIIGAAMQMIVLIGHFAAVVEADGMRRAYWAMTQLPPVLIALLMGIATVRHRRRLRNLRAKSD